MLDKFTKELEILEHFKYAPVIAVGISGGSDSTALVLLANEWAKKNNSKIVALTINHNLREGALEEARQVEELLREHCIEHHILEWKHSGVGSNIQNQARVARLSLLTEWCKKNKIEYLLLGQTKNDLAETFLMRSFRGSGIYGLAAIPKTTLYNKALILRPLLNFTKTELQDYLKNKNIQWIEDPSNDNTSFLRTNIRRLLCSDEAKKIIEDPTLMIDRLALNAKNLARARSYIEEQAAKEVARIVNIFPEGYLTIKHEDFCVLHPEIALYILSSCLTTISGKHIYKPRLNSLEKLYNLILLKTNVTSTLWECEITKKNKHIYIYREVPKYKYTLEKKEENCWIWDSRFEIMVENPEQIQCISNFDRTKLENYNQASFAKLPKKIWSSLPQITLTNNKVLVPFLTDIESNGIKVNFMPATPLVKIKFDY